jgi:Sulfotransferase domain
MALKLIGAGLGRNGTFTLKNALEQLGFGPCHHMVEVFAHPEQNQFWLRAAMGENVDWEEMFGDYKASVDWPSCHFYKELSERYPEAKVILSERDPKQWYESITNTILKGMQRMETDDPARAEWFRFARMIVVEQTFHNNLDEDNMIAAYLRHNAEVKAVIAPERLLVFNPVEGWDPLCRFLGMPVSQTAFPRLNTREEFNARRAGNAGANNAS